jgi:hypothetical protein
LSCIEGDSVTRLISSCSVQETASTFTNRHARYDYLIL